MIRVLLISAAAVLLLCTPKPGALTPSDGIYFDDVKPDSAKTDKSSTPLQRRK